MLLRAHAAPCGECSYYVDSRRYYHVRIMRDFTPFFNLQTILSIIFSPSVRSSIVHSRNSYLVYRQLHPEIISHKVSTLKIQSCLILGKTKSVTAFFSIFSQYTDLHYICIKPTSGSKQNISRDNLTRRCSTVSLTDARVNIASC